MSNGTSFGIFTAPMAGITASSENVPEHAICFTGSPSREKRVVPSSRPPVAIAIAPGFAQEPLPVRAEVALRRTAGPTTRRRDRRPRARRRRRRARRSAGAFVAEHDRERAHERAVLDRQVGVAHAGRAHADHDFTGARRLELELLDLERLVEPDADGGLRHDVPPRSPLHVRTVDLCTGCVSGQVRGLRVRRPARRSENTIDGASTAEPTQQARRR